MPLIGSQGAASARGFGLFARVAVGPSGYMATATGTANASAASGVFDSLGNFYVVGNAVLNGADDFAVLKYDPTGNLLWQRALGNNTTGSSDVANSVAIDGSNNLYVVGHFEIATGVGIVKYDTNGNVLWQKKLTGTGSSIGYSVSLDSSSNLYIAGSTLISPQYRWLITKIDTNGVLQWQRTVYSGTASAEGYGVSVDSSSNMYSVGYSTISSVTAATIIKTNTSGGIQYQRRVTSSGTNFNKVVTSSDGTSFVLGTTNSKPYVIVYGSSATVFFEKRIDVPSSFQAGGIAIDSSDNIYIIGTDNSSGTIDLFLAKYNYSFGQLLWTRRIKAGNTFVGTDIRVDSSGSMYITAHLTVSSVRRMFAAKLPSDGSKTGTYSVGGVTFTYETTSYTSTDVNLTKATPSLTNAIASLTDTTPSLPVNSINLTTAVTPV